MRQALVAVTVVAAAVGVVVALVVAVALVGAGSGERDRKSGDGLVPARVARGTPVRPAAPLSPILDVGLWAARESAVTGIPVRALRAYAAAEIAQRADTPQCRLSWATLAGIGRVESDHGRFRGAHLDEDGVARPRIVGVPLDGTRGTAEIRDTDGGRLDGDPVYDRAVGPMQFLPQTWQRFGRDGNGDGVADPNQIDDAARTAAAYLCSEGRDTESGDGWWDGVLAYNRSLQYARLVWAATDRYATSYVAS